MYRHILKCMDDAVYEFKYEMKICISVLLMKDVDNEKVGTFYSNIF